MLFATLVVLTAGPPDAIVGFGDSDGSAARALRQGLTGIGTTRTVTDESQLYAVLTKQMFDSFEGFTALPPPGWPASLVEQWKYSMARCRQLVGAPPYPATSLAFRCSTSVRDSLWRASLGSKQVGIVYELHVTRVTPQLRLVTRAPLPIPDAGELFVLSGVSSLADGSDELRVTEFTTSTSLETGLKVAVRKLEAQRALAPRQPVQPFVDAFGNERVFVDQVSNLYPCDGLPSALVITDQKDANQQLLGESLTKRWAASVVGTAPPLRCSLQVTASRVGSGLRASTGVFAKLTCGPPEVKVEGDAWRSFTTRRSLSDLVSDVLLRELVKRQCAELTAARVDTSVP